MGDEPAGTEEKEPNNYKATLEDCRDSLIPNAIDMVYSGTGDPGKPIADAISGGGWECTAADEWVSDLLQHTNKVMPAFEDALTDVNKEIAGEPDKVPENDYRGDSWSRTWMLQRRNI